MAFKVYINGKLFDKDDAKISVYDHGLLYGDGVFEGIRAYGGKVFRTREHLARLWNSAKAICLTIPISLAEMEKAIYETLSANNLKDAYIRLVVTRGAGSLGLDPNRTSDPQVIIITDKIVMYPAEYYENGLSIITASTIRNHPAALSPRIKSLNYLNNIKKAVKSAGKRKNVDEYLETITIEDCGKSRVHLGGLAVTLHERNLRALYEQMHGA